MSGTDIFLSYSREDRAAARHFADCFTREGFSVWWDAALRSGQTFDEVIEKELRAAKAVVVLWSPRSVASRWVRAEATLADRRNKLVPAIIETCDRPIIFELTHAAELADWTGDTSDIRWRTLVNDLRRLVGGGEEDEEAVAEPAPEPVVQPVAAEPAEPKPEPAAPVQKPAVQPQAEVAKPLAPANVDDLMFAAARLREDRAGSRLVKPAPVDVDDQTQFFQRCDTFDATAAEEVHCLQIVGGTTPDTRFVVTTAGLRIGRSRPADIVVPGSAVSRAHCLVELSGGQVRVTDLNSTNGSYVDGKRITRPAMLAVGSVLRVGDVSFEHEVHTRAELQWASGTAALDRGPNARAARVANS